MLVWCNTGQDVLLSRSQPAVSFNKVDLTWSMPTSPTRLVFVSSKKLPWSEVACLVGSVIVEKSMNQSTLPIKSTPTHVLYLGQLIISQLRSAVVSFQWWACHNKKLIIASMCLACIQQLWQAAKCVVQRSCFEWNRNITKRCTNYIGRLVLYCSH